MLSIRIVYVLGPRRRDSDASPVYACCCLSRDGMADRPDPRPPPAVFLQHHQIFLNQPLRERVHGHVADFVALALDAEMDDALAALHVAQAQQTEFLATDPS